MSNLQMATDAEGDPLTGETRCYCKCGNPVFAIRYQNIPTGSGYYIACTVCYTVVLGIGNH